VHITINIKDFGLIN